MAPKMVAVMPLTCSRSKRPALDWACLSSGSACMLQYSRCRTEERPPGPARIPTLVSDVPMCATSVCKSVAYCLLLLLLLFAAAPANSTTNRIT